GACAEVCPVYFKSEFDMGLGVRKGAYVPFPQAVPLKYTLELDKCMRCGLCKLACEAGAIDYDQREEIVEVDVGVIVVATGYDIFDPSLKPEYGYGKYDNVITGLEFERLCNASGPTGGKILLKNGEEPKKVVFISCVGSRDKEGNAYCSRVCCMYTAKHAHLIREKIPDAEVTILYTDVRAFGKGYEEFYERVKDEGARYIRRDLEKPIEVIEKDGKLLVRAENEQPIELESDLVVLATATVPRKDAIELARILKISRSADGFFAEAHPKLRPVDTFTDGIYLAGACQGPKDIPDSVSQASGSAIKASIPLAKGKVEIEPIISSIDEEICSGCRMCEGICAYGALSFDEIRKIMTVNAALCKGCGSCGTTCPSGAISMKHFKDEQIFAQIGAILQGV
ncbi:MAG: 4Fe-4S binding protein, partial [Candidatus Syntropharchaeia archaeon]